ncbi:MAG TPA: tetratricopeptide repeat protein [Armatimonadota bacterium]|jgi:tetratricopeptide (TPR) repeat protein
MKRLLTISIAALSLAAAASALPAGTEAAAQATREGRWADAAKLWQTASARLPDDADVIAELGWAEMQSGKAQDARRDFNRALRLSAGNLRAQTGLVALALKGLRLDEALELALAATRAHPEEAAAFRALGDAHLASSHRSEAESAYRRAVALDPSDPAAHASLANTLLIRNKADEAIKEYRIAVRLLPANAAYQEGLGRADMAGGLYGEAAKSFASAMDLVMRPVPDWDRLDTLSLALIDALGRSGSAVRSGEDARQDLYEANQTVLKLTDSLAEIPAIRDADPTRDDAMSQRGLAYSLLGQAAASDSASLQKNAAPEPAADAVVFREQARRAIVAAKAAKGETRIVG